MRNEMQSMSKNQARNLTCILFNSSIYYEVNIKSQNSKAKCSKPEKSNCTKLQEDD